MLIQGEEVTCKKVRTGEFKALQVHVKDCGKNCNLVHSVLPSTLGKKLKTLCDDELQRGKQQYSYTNIL